MYTGHLADYVAPRLTHPTFIICRKISSNAPMYLSPCNMYLLLTWQIRTTHQEFIHGTRALATFAIAHTTSD